MRRAANPSAFPTQASPATPIDVHYLNTIRTEIIVLAVTILLLVSQLVLIIWLFAWPRERSAARQKGENKEQRFGQQPPDDATKKPVITLNDGNEDLYNENNKHSQSQSNAWDSHATSDDQGQHHQIRRRRRRSSGAIDTPHFSPTAATELADLRSHLSSPDAESSSSRSSKDYVRKTFRDVGLMAATALALPLGPSSPRRFRSSPSSPDTDEGSEGTGSSNGIGGAAGFAQEMGFLSARLSPRSPRPGPVSRKTISAIMEGENKKDHQMGVEEEEQESTSSPDLVGSFDDPLGVNRRPSTLLVGNTMAPYEEEEARRRRRSGTR